MDLVLLWEGHLPACASLTLLLVPTTGSALSNDTHSIYYLRQRSFLFKKKGAAGREMGCWHGRGQLNHIASPRAESFLTWTMLSNQLRQFYK